MTNVNQLMAASQTFSKRVKRHHRVGIGGFIAAYNQPAVTRLSKRNVAFSIINGGAQRRGGVTFGINS